jgi:Flp pilus assembly protein TadD
MSLINRMLADLDARRVQPPRSADALFGDLAPVAPLAGAVRTSTAFGVALAGAALLIAVANGLAGGGAPWSRDARTAGRSVPAAPLPAPRAAARGAMTSGAGPAPAPAPATPPPVPAAVEPTAIAPAPAPEAGLSEAAPESAPQEIALEALTAPESGPAPSTMPNATTDADPAMAVVRTGSEPHTDPARYRVAVMLIQRERYADAAVELKRWLDEHPDDLQARLMLVNALTELERVGDVRRVLEQGIARMPDDPRLAMPYARLLVEDGDVAGALGTLERADTAGTGPDYQAFLAALAQRLDRHERAIAAYRRALAERPDAGLWWMGLGISLGASGVHRDAADAFRRALADRGLAPNLRAFALTRLGEMHGGRH